ncbi:MAG: alpha/beta hydrolase, partial [Actinomycetes bacterium]
LPSATLVLAGHDPLVDEGFAYRDLLESNGVPVRVLDFPGQIHGFFSLGELIPEAGTALREVAQSLRAAFDAASG